jgi:hypothetical protein
MNFTTEVFAVVTAILLADTIRELFALWVDVIYEQIRKQP